MPVSVARKPMNNMSWIQRCESFMSPADCPRNQTRKRTGSTTRYENVPNARGVTRISSSGSRIDPIVSPKPWLKSGRVRTK